MRMLLLKTWRDMLARKGQFAALILLVALGISIYVGFIEGYRNLKTSAELAYEQLKFEDFAIKVLGAPASAADHIAALPGVAAVEGRLVGDVGLDVAPGEQGTARVIGTRSSRRSTVDDVLVEAGRYLEPEDHDAALLHSQWATALGVHPGDSVTLLTGEQRRALRIVGVVASPDYMFPTRAKGELPSLRGFTILWVPKAAAEDILGRPGLVTDIAVRVRPGFDAADVMDAAEDELEPYGVVATTLRADQPSNSSLASEIDENRILASIMPPLILIIAMLCLAIALSRLVQSQRGEIGLAKALGYSNGQILAHYLLFSLAVAVVGTGFGIGIGHLIAIWMTGLYVDMLHVPFLESRIYSDVLLSAGAMSIVACVIAGIVPAWRSATMTPARAMHPDPNLALKGGRIPLVEKLLGPILPRSLVARMPIRNVFRARRRSAYTVIGIALAMLLSVGVVAFYDSINYLLNQYFRTVERWDVSAFFDRPFGGSVVDEVRHWDGVIRVQPVLMVPATLETARAKHDGAITAMDPTADFHRFDIVEGPSATGALRGGGLVVPDIVAEKLGVAVGDNVNVKTPYRDKSVAMRISAVSREAIGTPIFASLSSARELIGSSHTQYNGLYLNSQPQAAPGIRERLFDLPSASQVNVLGELEAMLKDMMGFMYVMFDLLLGFGFAMAFVVIYNTFTANVLERTREIATMRTIGEDAGHLSVMITVENLLLAVVGIPLGVWGGIRVAQYVLDQMASEEFAMRIIIEPSSIAWVTLAVLGVLLISEVPPVRRIFRLDLAQATKVIE